MSVGLVEKEGGEDVIKEFGVVITGSLAVRAPIDLQDLGLHDVLTVGAPLLPGQHEVAGVHGAGLGTARNPCRWWFGGGAFEDLPEHGKDFLLDVAPTMLWILILEEADEIVAEHLLQFYPISIVHDGEMLLVDVQVI